MLRFRTMLLILGAIAVIFIPSYIISQLIENNDVSTIVKIAWVFSTILWYPKIIDKYI
jgi:hypothetical protein